MTDIMRKLSAPTVVDMDKLSEKTPIKVRTPLFEVYGIIASRKHKVSDYGESFAFNGQFEAVVVTEEFALAGDTVGSVKRAGKAFFPKHLEELICAQFPDEGRADIQLAVRIGVDPAPKGKPSQTGYVWYVESLIPPSASSAVAMLRTSVQAQLPAPPVKSPESALPPFAAASAGKKK